MTTNQQEPQAQLLSALRAAEAAIEEATDFLHYEDGEPVVARDAERAYLALTGVLVEVDAVSYTHLTLPTSDLV